MINNIPTSKFVALCHTTRNTLRYYEKIALLVPVTDEKTGYKYYNAEQITTFRYIEQLKSLKYSLTEIQNILSFNKLTLFLDSINNKIDTLNKQKQEIESSIFLLERIKFLFSLIKNMPKDEYSLIDIPTDTLISKLPLVSNIPIDSLCLSDLLNNLCLAINADMPIGFYLNKDSFSIDNSFISSIFCFLLNKLQNQECELLPKGKYFIYINTKYTMKQLIKIIYTIIKNNDIAVNSDIYFCLHPLAKHFSKNSNNFCYVFFKTN